jgi:adenylosuccinate synthase
MKELVQDDHNADNEWQKDFRVGTFDGVMLDYALRVNGPVDSIAITHTDKLTRHAWWEVADSYDFDPIPEAELPQQEILTQRLFHTIPHVKQIAAYQMVDWIAARAKAPVSVASLGPKPSDKIFR